MNFIRAAFIVLLLWPLAATAEDNLVLKLEQYLAQLGFNPGVVDGVADAATSAAIQSYQQARGLPVTGGMTFAEYQALERDAQSGTAATPTAQQTPTSAGPGQLTITTTQGAGGSIYHKLSGCQAREGVAIVTYNNARRSHMELSDICFDPDGGWVAGSETLSGLSLVSQQEVMTVYEVIASGRQDYERHAVTLDKFDQTNGWATNIGIRTNSKFPSARHPGNQLHAGGVLFGTPFPKSGLRTPLKLYFQISTLLPGVGIDKGVCQLPAPSYATGEPDYVALEGLADLRSSGTIQLTSAEGTTEKSQGTMVLNTSDSGDVTGTASIYFENPRITGHGPCEWLRSQVEFDLIVGKLSGDKFPEIRASGIGRGRYTDVHGGTYDLLVYATVSAYPPEMSE